jgi:hypothetical protein
VFLLKRRARDSNPQPVSRHLISSQAANHSLTLPVEHPIKYEPPLGGKITDQFAFFCRLVQRPSATLSTARVMPDMRAFGRLLKTAFAAMLCGLI